MSPETVSEGIDYGVIKEKVDQLRRELRVVDAMVKAKASTKILMGISFALVGIFVGVLGYLIEQNAEVMERMAGVSTDVKVMVVQQQALSNEINLRFKIAEDAVGDIKGQGERNKSHIMDIEKWMLAQ